MNEKMNVEEIVSGILCFVLIYVSIKYFGWLPIIGMAVLIIAGAWVSATDEKDPVSKILRKIKAGKSDEAYEETILYVFQMNNIPEEESRKRYNQLLDDPRIEVYAKYSVMQKMSKLLYGDPAMMEKVWTMFEKTEEV